MNRKYLPIPLIGILVLAIPLTVFLSQQVQNLRQKAAELEILPYAGMRGVADILYEDFENANLPSRWNTQIIEPGNILELQSTGEAERGSVLHVQSIGGQDEARLVRNIEPTTELYTRMFVKFLSDVPQLEATQAFFMATTDKDGMIGAVGMRTTSSTAKNIISYNPAGAWKRIGTKTLHTNTWYCVETHIATGTLGQMQVWIDGEEIANEQEVNMGIYPIAQLKVGLKGAPPGNFYIDEFAADHTYRMGCGKLSPDEGPLRNNIAPQGRISIQSTQATLAVDTQDNAVCKYDSASKSYPDMANTLSTNPTTTHRKQISVSPSTEYTFYLRCKDSQLGKENTTDEKISFITDLNMQSDLPAVALTSTYESISIYASFTGDDNKNNSASFEYRQVGTTPWMKGMEMTPDRREFVTDDVGKSYSNNFKNQYRASVLSVEPDKPYEIRVTLVDPDNTAPVVKSNTIQTRKETFPSTGTTYYVSPNGNDTETGSSANPWKTLQKAADAIASGDTVIVKPGTYQEILKISRSGTPTNYTTFRTDDPLTSDPSDTLTPEKMKRPEYANLRVVIDGVITDANDIRPVQNCPRPFDKVQNKCNVEITGQFIRFAGFEIMRGDMGVSVKNNDGSSDLIIENNYIHDLAHSFNAGGRETMRSGIFIGSNLNPGTTKRITIQGNEIVTNTNKDQSGANITIESTAGEHIVRNNRMINLGMGNNIHGHDCITGGPDFEPWGGYLKDTDIYNNYCYGATDEGIELDGANVNVRVWNNTLKGTNLGFSVTPVLIGPTYIFRNVMYEPHQAWTGCIGIKSGVGGGAKDDRGHVYVYHNTFYLANLGRIDGTNSIPRCAGVRLKSVNGQSVAGSGYTAPPTVVITGGGGSGAKAIAEIKNGQVSEIATVDGGSGYTSTPTVILSGGGGSGAEAVVDLNGGSANIWSPNGDPPDSENLFMKNNILHGYDRTFNFFRNETFLKADYNMHAIERSYGRVGQWASRDINDWSDFQSAPCTDAEQEKNSIVCQEEHGLLDTKADFVNPITGDFRLKNGSPGINAGVSIVGFNDPNSAWPAVDSPDMGAYESGSATIVSPTATLTQPVNGTSLLLTLKLHGLGNGGDTVNPNSQGNMTPLRTTRPVTVEMYSALNNQLVGIATGSVTYNVSTGVFIGTIQAPIAVTTTGYNLRVTSPGFLVAQQLGVFVTQNQTNTVPTLALTTGDINDDKMLDILDYNMLVSCYGAVGSTKPSTCTGNGYIDADLFDDGNVNFIDLNLWLREFSKKS